MNGLRYISLICRPLEVVAGTYVGGRFFDAVRRRRRSRGAAGKGGIRNQPACRDRPLRVVPPAACAKVQAILSFRHLTVMLMFSLNTCILRFPVLLSVSQCSLQANYARPLRYSKMIIFGSFLYFICFL